MIIEIYKDGMEYSVKSIKTLIQLGIISILSILIIPIFLLYGYSYKVIEVGLNGIISHVEDPVPKIENIAQMLKKGVKLFLVGVIYSLPSLLITAAFLYDKLTLQKGVIGFHLNIGLIPAVLILLLWFFSFLFMCVAIPYMIKNDGSLKQAFNIREIKKIIENTGFFEYLKFYILSIVILAIFIIAAFFISQIAIDVIYYLNTAFLKSSISNNILDLLNLYLFLIVYLAIQPIYLIIESRSMSFIYNDDLA